MFVPSLLVRGRLGDIVGDDGVDDLRRLIPHVEFVDVAGTGHMVAGDDNDAFNAAVESFLARGCVDDAAGSAGALSSVTNRSGNATSTALMCFCISRLKSSTDLYD